MNAITACRGYLCAIILLGMVTLAWSLYRIAGGNAPMDAAILMALAAATAILSLRIPGTNVMLSVSDVFVFANLLLFGPAMGAVTAAIEGIVGSLRVRRTARGYLYISFNASSMCIGAYAAGWIFQRLFPSFNSRELGEALFLKSATPLVVLALTYYFLNTMALATVIGLDRHESIVRTWQDHLSWTAAGYMLASLMAGLVALTTASMSVGTVGTILIVPASTFLLYRRYVHVQVASRSAFR